MTEEEKKAKAILDERIWNLLDVVCGNCIIEDDERDEYQKSIEICSELIEKQQKEIERLQRIKSCNISKMIDEEKVNIYKNYIPRSKIEEKIKNIDEQIEIIKICGCLGMTETPDLKFHKKILQDLLESDYPFVPYNTENKSRFELEEEIKELKKEFEKRLSDITKHINTESEE